MIGGSFAPVHHHDQPYPHLPQAPHPHQQHRTTPPHHLNNSKSRFRDKEKALKTGSLTMADPTVEIAAQQVDASLGVAKMTTQEGQMKREMNEEMTMKKVHIDAHQTERSTGRTTPFDWAKDIDKSISLSPATAMDMEPTVCIDKAMAKAPVVTTSPVAYSPHDLSALCSGTQNLWGTLSHRHHRHHHSQPPCNLSTPNSTT